MFITLSVKGRLTKFRLQDDGKLKQQKCTLIKLKEKYGEEYAMMFRYSDLSRSFQFVTLQYKVKYTIVAGIKYYDNEQESINAVFLFDQDFNQVSSFESPVANSRMPGKQVLYYPNPI